MVDPMPYNERDLLVGLSARRFFLPGAFGEEI
jgi:hypothetical protein